LKYMIGQLDTLIISVESNSSTRKGNNSMFLGDERGGRIALSYT
jgi:hypothetical protein